MEMSDQSDKVTIAGSQTRCKDPEQKKISRQHFYLSPGYHPLFYNSRNRYKTQ